MKQVVDRSGEKIKGLFREDDGSLVVIDNKRLMQAQMVKSNMESLTNQIDTLQNQVKEILEKRNFKNLRSFLALSNSYFFGQFFYTNMLILKIITRKYYEY